MEVQAAIAAGADVNYSDGLFTCLMMACAASKPEIVTLNEFNKQFMSSTALLFAAQSDHAEGTVCIELMLGAGCDIEGHSNDGRTALDMAMYFGNVESVKTLVRAGADVTSRRNGSTADERANALADGDAMQAALRLPSVKRVEKGRCKQCFATSSEKMLRCSACKNAYYCNAECQSAHWRRHKPTCKAASE
jgi:ankyrin repeat protein